MMSNLKDKKDIGRLDGKVVVITGGVGGQGSSHAQECIKEGAKVVVTDIDTTKGESLEKELGNNGKFIQHDVTKESDWQEVIQETESLFGPINVLINNAGIYLYKNIEDTSEEEFRKILDINLIGQFLGMKTVLPSMKKTKNGSIINISSIEGLRVPAGSSAYVSSKFGVRGITKSAAIEFAEYGIRVNSVHPGAIQTQALEGDDVKAAVEAFTQTIPFKRNAKPEEVSKLILFLASDEASYSSGSEFVLDGGLSAHI